MPSIFFCIRRKVPLLSHIQPSSPCGCLFLFRSQALEGGEDEGVCFLGGLGVTDGGLDGADAVAAAVYNVRNALAKGECDAGGIEDRFSGVADDVRPKGADAEQDVKVRSTCANGFVGGDGADV